MPKKTPQPEFIPPMLATLAVKAPDEPGWLYEIKWDGYRAIAYCDTSQVTLLSRNRKSFNEKYYPLVQALEKLQLRAILDGEIVVLNEEGAASFGALQNWRSEADGELYYYVFDLLWLDGRSLMDQPLSKRKEQLKRILPGGGIIRASDTFDASAEEVLAAAKRMGLEGIIAKRADSLYRPGERVQDWLKLKAQNRIEVVIGGYTLNEGSPKPFSSLLVGVFDGHVLNYIGKIGTGFSQKLQKEMMGQFKPLIAKKCPFAFEPDVNKPSRFRPNPPHVKAVWLKPELVCEVSFVELYRARVGS
jgi:bifunctional non-homologous end joining protein LigD